MKWFLNLRTRYKLVFGFGLIIILMAAITLTAYVNISDINTSQRTLFAKDFTITNTLHELKENLHLQRAVILEMMATNNKMEQQMMEQDIKKRAQDIDQKMQALSEQLQNDLTLFNQLKELKTKLEALRQVRNTQVIPLIYEGKTDEARNLLIGIQKDRYDTIISFATGLVGEAEKRAQAAVAQSEQRTNKSIRAFIILGMISLLVAVVMTFFLNAIIASPLKDISKIAERVAAGDLTVKVSASDQRDEVGVLSQTFRTMVNNLRRTTLELAEGVNVLAASASEIDRKSTRLNSSHIQKSRMPSSA